MISVNHLNYSCSTPVNNKLQVKVSGGFKDKLEPQKKIKCFPVSKVATVTAMLIFFLAKLR